jgi:hypothetical protein
MKTRLVLTALALVALGTATFASDLFEEAGHDLGKSRWVMIRFLPSIEIALESDDVVLIQSVDHPPKGFAMKIDGKAVAADCSVTETKDTSYSVASESSDDKGKNKWTTGSTSTTTTYWSSCEFAEGTSEIAVSAHEIIVQVAMTNGTTKPHQLKSKELRKFQSLR